MVLAGATTNFETLLHLKLLFQCYITPLLNELCTYLYMYGYIHIYIYIRQGKGLMVLAGATTNSETLFHLKLLFQCYITPLLNELCAYLYMYGYIHIYIYIRQGKGLMVLAGATTNSETLLHLKLLFQCYITPLLNELRGGDRHTLSIHEIMVRYFYVIYVHINKYVCIHLYIFASHRYNM
jgi:hypothetical protein